MKTWLIKNFFPIFAIALTVVAGIVTSLLVADAIKGETFERRCKLSEGVIIEKSGQFYCADKSGALLFAE